MIFELEADDDSIRFIDVGDGSSHQHKKDRKTAFLEVVVCVQLKKLEKSHFCFPFCSYIFIK